MRISKVSKGVLEFLLRFPGWLSLHSVSPFPQSFYSVSMESKRLLQSVVYWCQCGAAWGLLWPRGFGWPLSQWADPFQSPSAAFVATLIYQTHSPASGSNNASLGPFLSSNTHTLTSKTQWGRSAISTHARASKWEQTLSCVSPNNFYARSFFLSVFMCSRADKNHNLPNSH